MKHKKILILIFIALGSALAFNACEEKNDYNYNLIEPIVMSINGPGEIAAHGLTAYPTTYTVPHRGGSTFAWSAKNANNVAATIMVDAVYPSRAYITFPQSSVLTTGTISVVETTAGGLVSPVKERTITLTPFCPYNMDALVGNWTGTGSAVSNPVVATKTANLNELKLRTLAGFISSSWGETWTVGDGSCVVEFSCGNNLTIRRQKIGETDYPDVYEMDGSGTYNTTAGTLTLTFKVYYTGGSTTNITTTLSKSTTAKLFEQFKLKK